MKKFYFLFLFSIYLHAADQLANDEEACMWGYNSRVILKHREAGGIGYEQGYTTLGVFLCPDKRNAFLPFIDLRGHYFNNGHFAGNAGIGWRLSDDSDTYVYGINAYYDIRDSNWIIPQQVGAGFEILGTWVDFRANGYYPFGKKKATRTTTDFAGFTGNGILFKRPFRIALPAIETEFGFPIGWPFNIVDLYLGVGPYYLFSESAAGTSRGNNLGIKARLTARLFDGILVGLDGSYDDLFGGTFQGFLALNFPIGPATMRKEGKRWKNHFKAPHCDEYARLIARQSQDVQRNEIIPICRGTGSFAPIISQTFIFVDNENPFVGNGTFENPFSTLALAQANSTPGDIIYIISSFDNAPYEEGITLQTSQRLQGSGKSFFLGSIEIDAITPGSNPIISNPLGTSIVMADNSIVFGINVSNSGINGIDAIDISNILIQENVISSNTISGFNGMNLGGINTITQNTFSSNFGFGADISTDDLAVVNITDNIFQGNVLSGLDLAAQAGTSTMNVTGNTFTQNDQYGLGYADLNAASTTLSITNNTFSNHLTSELLLEAVNGSTVTISSNTFSQTIHTAATTILGANLNGSATISNNTITDTPLMSSAVIDIKNPGSTTISISDNSITSPNLVSHINVEIGTTTTGTLNILRNKLSNATLGAAIVIEETSTGASWKTNINNNTISTGVVGITESVAGIMTSSISANFISSTLDLGFLIETTAATGNLCIAMQNNNGALYDFNYFAASTFTLRTNTGDIAASNNFSSLGTTGFDVDAGIVQAVVPCP